MRIKGKRQPSSSDLKPIPEHRKEHQRPRLNSANHENDVLQERPQASESS
jgi:hypothetical protein